MKNRQQMKMKRYKQKIAIIANWWRHSEEGSLVLSDIVACLSYLLFCCTGLHSSLSVSSERGASRRLCPLVSLSERLSFCLVLLPLLLSSSSRCLEGNFFGCLVLVRELPVEYPVSFLKLFGFLPKYIQGGLCELCIRVFPTSSGLPVETSNLVSGHFWSCRSNTFGPPKENLALWIKRAFLVQFWFGVLRLKCFLSTAKVFRSYWLRIESNEFFT